MPNSNKGMQNFKKYLTKTFHKFTNYTKNQKLFTLFLLVFAIALIVLPIAKINSTSTTQETGSELFWFIWTTYFRSMIVVFLSMLFLLGWNMNTRFKSFVVNFLWFRESEPMLNFIFLWVIAGNFLGIMDSISMVQPLTNSASIYWGWWVILFLLIIGIILSFIEVWKWADKNSQRTKVVTIVDEEEAPKKPEWGHRMVKHLFDDEDLEW